MQAAVRVLPEPARATAPHPLMPVPSAVNATGPVGAVPVTEAVNVTAAPVVDGLALDATVVVVGVELALETTCDSGALVDAPFAELPA